MVPFALLEACLRQVEIRIQEACREAGRERPPLLLAVTKTRPVDEIAALYQMGVNAFGENYLQEALPKIEALNEQAIEWHFIGPIQSNKTRRIAENFHWVHSVDSFKHARRLNDQRPAAWPPLNVLIQVNVDDEANKSGVAPEAAAGLAKQIETLPRLRLRGLMCLPKHRQNEAELRARFKSMRQLLKTLPGQLDTLSMGMSSDLEAAIAEGSTIVRVGTALFGPRPPKKDANVDSVNSQ